MIERTTPEHISSLGKNQVFVFGSNLSGIHGAGAAKQAMLHWGAKMGNGVGLHGKTYAIPTKNENITKSLPLNVIESYVKEFIKFAENNTHLTFLVTEIGCGLANFNPSEIAPLFKDAMYIENIYLPSRFWHILNH